MNFCERYKGRGLLQICHTYSFGDIREKNQKGRKNGSVFFRGNERNKLYFRFSKSRWKIESA